MNNTDYINTQNLLIELLEKLNNGEKISNEDIESQDNRLKQCIYNLDDIEDFPFDRNRDNEFYYFTKNTRKTFDKYHIQDIAKIIMEYKSNKDYENDIKYIIKESKLPRRDDEKYKIISSYEPYELTHCISYEMAIRNKEVINLLETLKLLTIIHKKQFIANISSNDIEIQDTVRTLAQQVCVHLDFLKSPHKIDFNNFDSSQAQNDIMSIIAELTTILEEDYYMIYDRKEITPEGMEDVLKEPNHYEPDIELNNFMNKAIIYELYDLDNSPRYKDNFSKEDGYVIYQGVYDESVSYDINKIFPNFKRPMREFNQTQVAFNMSLPKDEIMKYIEKIKDDYDNKNTSYKTLDQLLYGDDTRTEDKLNHKRLKDYADDFFIYDYYVQSEEEHEKKLEIIQRKLSQHHGMKVEKGRNCYELISYDDAQIKMHTPKSNQKGRSLADLVNSFQESEHIIHHLETIKLIDERYEVLKNLIDNKKYKTLIHHR